jgi:phosphoribosyl 1,2-cyclic phosphodiesterase
MPANEADALPPAAAPREQTCLRFWGTRGSIPTPGPTTVRYGGNTSCVEIRVGDTLLILDAGTGIRALGTELKRQRGFVRATVLLTHFHWDHIQGLPFFKPLHDPDARLDVFAPAADDATVQQRLGHQMKPAFFPVPFENIRADCRFAAWTQGEKQLGSCRVAVFPARHPSQTVGFRIDTPTGSIGYLPDNELVGGRYDMGPDWRRGLEEFLADVDVLIHDAMVVGEDYRRYEGWGHSTVEQALDLARGAGAKHLVGFHHSPYRSDDELDDELRRVRRLIPDGDVRFSLAAEGDEVIFDPDTAP